MKEWTPEEIREFRHLLKLTQGQFGELLGITRYAIYYLERGEREPSKTLRLLLSCIEQQQEKRRKEKEQPHGKRTAQKG